jgi:hypothetical protein
MWKMSFGLWFGIVIIFKDTIQNLLGICTLSKIHSYEKNISKQKEMQSLFKVMLLAHCILFAPKNNFIFQICAKFHTK